MQRGTQEIKEEGWMPSEVPSRAHKSLCLRRRFPCRDFVLEVIPGKGNKVREGETGKGESQYKDVLSSCPLLQTNELKVRNTHQFKKCLI